MQVKVTVNERGALRNGRFAFTDRFTLVTELLQNSRRAGASQVWVTHDEQAKTLAVEDDGSGIADFQKLLTVNESGWDEIVQQEEHAFGVGFSNVLYAAKRCTVQSRGLSMTFSTDAALNQDLIDVVDDSSVHPYRTRVVLEGVDLPGLEEQLPDMVCGFPLPVTFNGVLLPRPHCESALLFTDSPIGKVHLYGRDDGQDSRDTHVYLQGFCVHKPTWTRHEKVHVVHLDARRFIARLPDRRVLLDECEQLVVIRQTMCKLWREVLLNAKNRLPADVFCDRYWDIARTWCCQDVFDDVPVLPKQVCSRIGCYPVQKAQPDDGCLVDLESPLTRSAVEQGEVHLAYLDVPGNDNMARWMFARHRGLVLVRTYLLSARHWARSLVRQLERDELAVEAVEPGVTATFSGRGIDIRLQLCERVSIRSGTDLAEIADDAVWDGQVLYVPREEMSGCGVQQVFNYVDGSDHFNEDARDADRDDLAILIARLRYSDPREAFKSCLAELALGQYPLICGREYLIRIGNKGQIELIELVEQAAAG